MKPLKSLNKIIKSFGYEILRLDHGYIVYGDNDIVGTFNKYTEAAIYAIQHLKISLDKQ